LREGRRGNELKKVEGGSLKRVRTGKGIICSLKMGKKDYRAGKNGRQKELVFLSMRKRRGD